MCHPGLGVFQRALRAPCTMQPKPAPSRPPFDQGWKCRTLRSATVHVFAAAACWAPGTSAWFGFSGNPRSEAGAALRPWGRTLRPGGRERPGRSRRAAPGCHPGSRAVPLRQRLVDLPQMFPCERLCALVVRVVIPPHEPSGPRMLCGDVGRLGKLAPSQRSDGSIRWPSVALSDPSCILELTDLTLLDLRMTRPFSAPAPGGTPLRLGEDEAGAGGSARRPRIGQVDEADGPRRRPPRRS